MYAMNNATSMNPSFLSYLLWVLPNMKNNIVTPNINIISNSILWFIDIGLIALLAPRTNEILKIFDPITLPITN